jgi:hypothetical protein
MKNPTETSPSALQDNKLLYVLESFTKTDLNRFHKFILSPYFNAQEVLVNLYILLLPTLKGQCENYPDKHTLYKNLFKTAYNDVKMRRAFSDLLRLAEDYMAMEKYRSKPEHMLSDGLHAINERGLTRLFDVNYTLAKTLQSKNKNADAEFYYTAFMLESELNQHLELEKKRTEKKNLEQVLYHLDAFYIIHKLRYACIIEHYRNVLKIDIDPAMTAAILDEVKTNKYGDIAAIAIYHAVYHMLREADGEPHLKELKTLLAAQPECIPQAVERDAYIFAINFCVKQINRGKLDYLREVFDLYNVALEKDFLFDKNELSPWDYKNLVTLGLRLKEQKWTESFIKEYRDRIPKTARSNAYTFNLAKFYFYIQRYDEVLKLLQGVKYDDMFYLLDSKTLLAKTYYEMTEYEALYSLISSFKVLLRRKRKISDTHRRNYINLLNFITKLSRADVRDKKLLQELKDEFEKTTQMADAGWLREKFEELGV